MYERPVCTGVSEVREVVADLKGFGNPEGYVGVVDLATWSSCLLQQSDLYQRLSSSLALTIASFLSSQGTHHHREPAQYLLSHYSRLKVKAHCRVTGSCVGGTAPKALFCS